MLQIVPRPSLQLPPGLIMPERKIAAPSGMYGGMTPMDGMGGRRRGIGGGGGGGGDGSLKDIVSSCVFDLDATISGSYSGTGQNWNNLVTSPADGSAQSVYNYYRGTSSGADASDAAFTGTAGNAAAYWSLDGNDQFSSANGSTPAFINNLHKTTGGQAATIIMALRGTSGSGYLFGTAPTGAGSGNDGIYIYQSGSTGCLFDQFYSTTYARTSFSFSNWNGVNVILAIAFDFTASTLYYAMNARTFSSTTLNKGTTTANAYSNMRVGGVPGGAAPNTTRLYHFSMYNAILSNANLSALVTALNTRHGRTYVA